MIPETLARTETGWLPATHSVLKNDFVRCKVRNLWRLAVKDLFKKGEYTKAFFVESHEMDESRKLIG